VAEIVILLGLGMMAGWFLAKRWTKSVAGEPSGVSILAQIRDLILRSPFCRSGTSRLDPDGDRERLAGVIAQRVLELGRRNAGSYDIVLPQSVLVYAAPLDAAVIGEDLFGMQRLVAALVNAKVRHGVRHVPGIRLSVVRDPAVLLGHPTVEEALGRGYEPTRPYDEPTQRRLLSTRPPERQPSVDRPSQHGHPPIHDHPRAAANPVARLVFLGTPSRTVEVPRGGGVVGRDDEQCSIVVDAATVSRRHVTLTPIPDGFHVRDLGSSNGMTINAKRVSTGELRNGDVLGLGNQVRLCLELSNGG
jgi:FHA domain